MTAGLGVTTIIVVLATSIAMYLAGRWVGANEVMYPKTTERVSFVALGFAVVVSLAVGFMVTGAHTAISLLCGCVSCFVFLACFLYGTRNGKAIRQLQKQIDKEEWDA